MSDQNVFDDTKPNEEETPPATEENNNTADTSQLDTFVEKLMEIKREDGSPKYESVTDALDALKHSQEHIQKLEAERKNEKEQLEYYMKQAKEAETLRETIERLNGKNMTEQEKPKLETPTSGGLSEEKVVELFNQLDETKRQQEIALSNLKMVNDTIASKYGDKAVEMAKTVAEANDFTLDELKAFSAEKPKAALALFGEAPKKLTTPNTSSTYVAPNSSSTIEVAAPERSLLSGPGANDRDRTEYLRRIKEKVYKENGINI